MKALFELFRRFDARRIFGFIRRLGGMSRPKVKCYDLLSTHALRVEGDATSPTHINAMDIFLSTPSGWRATFCLDFCKMYAMIFLSTPSGWRATRTRIFCAVAQHISIHALRVEGDADNMLPTIHRIKISIHALRVEGDRLAPSAILLFLYFYPRPPGGGRRSPGVCNHRLRGISIHALRVEGDAGCCR